MTMPHERTRSLRWGWELLGAIADDPEIEESIKQLAALIKGAYPPPELIGHLIAAESAGLPPAAAQSIAKAAGLFTMLRLKLQGTEQIRHHLRFTLRHFPEATDVHLRQSISPLLPHGLAAA